MCVCHVHWMDGKAAACSVSCIERVLPSLCQTHCCLTVTEDSTPMLGWTITRPFVQAAQKRCCQRARLMLLGNTTCCALVYSSSSSVLCVYTSPFSRGWGGLKWWQFWSRVALPKLLSSDSCVDIAQKAAMQQHGSVYVANAVIYSIYQYWLKACTCTSQKLFIFAVSMILVKTNQF